MKPCSACCYCVHYVLTECDQGWDEVQQNCVLFVVKPSSYANAVQTCHDAGSILVDDLNQIKHSYLLGKYTFVRKNEYANFASYWIYWIYLFVRCARKAALK